MNPTTLFPTTDSTIAKRVHEIQRLWSPQERQRRAEAGRRLRRAFVKQIIDLPVEPELWAVGAPTDADWQRVAV